MSESQNVALARESIQSMAAADRERARRLFHADAQWHNTASWPGDRVCVGPDEIIDFWESLAGSLQGSSEIERVVAESDDVLVLAMRSIARGVTSGTPVDIRFGLVMRMRDGRIERADVHGDWQKALAAAELGDQR